MYNVALNAEIAMAKQNCTLEFVGYLFKNESHGGP